MKNLLMSGVILLSFFMAASAQAYSDEDRLTRPETYRFIFEGGEISENNAYFIEKTFGAEVLEIFKELASENDYVKIKITLRGLTLWKKDGDGATVSTKGGTCTIEISTKKEGDGKANANVGVKGVGVGVGGQGSGKNHEDVKISGPCDSINDVKGLLKILRPGVGGDYP